MKNSDIFNEYAKIMESMGYVDLKKTAEPMEAKSRYSKDYINNLNMLYGIKPDEISDKPILEQAHPESVVIAPSYDTLNGLVENLEERQAVMVDIAKREPNFNGGYLQKRYVKAHGDLTNELIRIATILDEKNDEELAIFADNCNFQLSKKASPLIPVAAALGRLALSAAAQAAIWEAAGAAYEHVMGSGDGRGADVKRKAESAAAKAGADAAKGHGLNDRSARSLGIGIAAQHAGNTTKSAKWIDHAAKVQRTGAKGLAIRGLSGMRGKWGLVASIAGVALGVLAFKTHVIGKFNQGLLNNALNAKDKLNDAIPEVETNVASQINKYLTSINKLIALASQVNNIPTQDGMGELGAQDIVRIAEDPKFEAERLIIKQYNEECALLQKHLPNLINILSTARDKERSSELGMVWKKIKYFVAGDEAKDAAEAATTLLESINEVLDSARVAITNSQESLPAIEAEAEAHQKAETEQTPKVKAPEPEEDEPSFEAPVRPSKSKEEGPEEESENDAEYRQVIRDVYGQ